jgi:hypothetical protein
MAGVVFGVFEFTAKSKKKQPAKAGCLTEHQ